MNESRRRALWRAIKLMLLVLLLAFVYVLLSATRVNTTASFSDASNDKQQSKLVSNINIGETVLRTYQGQRVWITRFSEQQRGRFTDLGAHVERLGGCKNEIEFCVLAASTDRAGINLSFINTEPPQLPSGVTWVGGFVDPTSGAVFDLWGRAYQFSEVKSLEVVLQQR